LIIVALLQETETLIQQESIKQGKDHLFSQEESLSDLDEDPEIINSLAMSDDETEFKKQLWLAENQDWVDKQATLPPVKPKQPPKKVD
jgi:Brf1-like TBP-binding domain